MDEHRMNEQKRTSRPEAPAERGAANPAAAPQELSSVFPPPQPSAVPRPVTWIKRSAAPRDLRLAAALLLLCFLLWDSVLWAKGFGLGIALPATGILVSAALWFRGAGKRRSAYGTACAVLHLIGGLSYAFSGDEALKALSFFALSFLFLIWVIEQMDLRSGDGLRARLRDLCFAAFTLTFGRLPESWWALFRGSGNDVRRKRFNGVLLGLLCAIPALIVLVPLLMSSDAAFEGLVGRLDSEILGRGLSALLLGFCGALLLFTLLFTAERRSPVREGAPFRGLEPVLVATFLGAISAAYVLYLAAQFAYFTDAFRGLLPENYTVAQYARRGFFEMCWIVAINLGLIVLSTRLCRKTGGNLPGAVKGLALFLCCFSLILVATALSKMFLYMNTLGLTRKRVLTSVFMLFLALVIAAVGLRLFVKKIPVPQFAVILGGSLLILLSLANVDGIVARYNVGAWRSGKLDSLDVATVCDLEDGAVPALTELLDDTDPKIANAARQELRSRLVRFGLAEWADNTAMVPADHPRDLRAWNLISQQARTVLLDERDRILAGD